MSVREQAEKLGFQIVGILTRHPEWEKSSVERLYMDAAGNEYFTRHGILTIITADGGVI